MKKQIVRCEHCNSIVSERQITLFKGMVWALWKVFQWCEANGIDTVQRKQFKGLFKNENETARFGDWVYFGDLVEKEKKGTYKLNFASCRRFFSGIEQIPTVVWKNPVTGETTAENKRFMRDVKGISELLDKDLMYIAKYR